MCLLCSAPSSFKDYGVTSEDTAECARHLALPVYTSVVPRILCPLAHGHAHIVSNQMPMMTSGGESVAESDEAWLTLFD